MRRLRTWLALLALTLFAGQSGASELIMMRSGQSFPEAMLSLQQAITAQGYTVSRVQRVDVGLTASGYETDRYRVVFFGKAEEVDEVTRTHPEMIPYLPWKIVIFAEEDETLMVTYDPQSFSTFFPDEDLSVMFARWRSDIHGIFERVRKTEQ
jgi:uncharacterized protein (DUF302 family)